MQGRKFWATAACVLVSGAVMFAIARVVPLQEVARVLREAQPTWILLAIVLSLTTRCASALRTYAITRGMRLPLTIGATLDAMLASNFWSLLLPGLSAGSIATVHKYRCHGVSIAESVSALTASRAIELASFAALSLVAVSITAVPDAVGLTIGLPIGLLALSILALVLMHRHAGQIASYLQRRNGERLGRILRMGARPFDAYARITRASLSRALGAGLLQASLEAATIMAVARAIDLPIDLGLAMSVAGLTYLTSLIPISVAGIGLRDAAVLSVLAPFGIAHYHAVAIATLMLGLVIVNGLIGGVVQGSSMWLRALRRQDARPAQSIS